MTTHKADEQDWLDDFRESLIDMIVNDTGVEYTDAGVWVTDEQVNKLLAHYAQKLKEAEVRARLDEIQMVDVAYHHAIDMKVEIPVPRLVENGVEHILLDDPRAQNDLFGHIQDCLAQLRTNKGGKE